MGKTQLREAFKLALSITLSYQVALALNFPSPKNAAIAIAVTSAATSGATFRNGLIRMLGTAGGVVAGLLILTVFSQTRWGFLLANFLFLVAASYAYQRSKYPSAWMLTGLTAVLVWSSSYMQVETAWRTGLFRFLEIGVGVVIYNTIGRVLWPLRAGPALVAQERRILDLLVDLFGICRQVQETGEEPESAGELRGKAAGALPPFDASLDAALLDTPSVALREPEWRALRARVEALGNSLELWRLSARDARDLPIDRLLPGLPGALDRVGARLERARDLAVARAGDDALAGDDASLEWPLAIEVGDRAALSHRDRAFLLSLVHHLRGLDEASRGLLAAERELAGLPAPAEASPEPAAAPEARESRWDPERLLVALFPALCFAACYLFWIYTAPPAGNAITIIGVAFGMMLMGAPLPLFKIVKVLLIAILLVAPIYMVVMPQLDSSAAILTLVFACCFLLGLLGGRLVPLRTFGLVAFALITNLTNRQGYSFLGVLYPMIMIFLGTTLVVGVQRILSPMRPEKVALRSARRFLLGCARILEGYAVRKPADRARGHASRRHSYRTMALPASRRLRMVRPGLDSPEFPDVPGAKVDRLLGAMQVLLFRFRALELSHERLGEVRVRLGVEGVSPAVSAVRESLERVFTRWARAPGTPALDEERGRLAELTDELRAELDALAQSEGMDEDLELFVWAELGSVRGLIEVAGELQDALLDIRWEQWAVERF